MSDNIFSNGEQTTAPKKEGEAATTPNVQNENSFADLLGTIKNERGEPKYRDLPTALDALKHSQEFIPQIRSENETLKAQLEELRSKVQELSAVKESVEKLTSTQQKREDTPPVQFDEKTVAELVNRTLTQRESEAIQKANITKVVSTIQERFGADSEKVFYARAQEMGMRPEQINKLAAESPTAVFRLFGIDQQQQVAPAKTGAPASNQVNTTGLQPQQTTYIGKNATGWKVGTTTSELRAESDNAKKLVEELHSQGLSTYDLTDPKVYYKYFK